MRLFAILSACLLLGTGCSTIEYQGTSPSARTFRDDPGLNDYYYGLDFTFALDRPTDYHPAVFTNDSLTGPPTPETLVVEPTSLAETK